MHHYFFTGIIETSQPFLYTAHFQRSPGQELFIPTTALLLPPVKDINADIAVHSIEIGTVVYIAHQSYSTSLPAHVRGSILHRPQKCHNLKTHLRQRPHALLP
ncbi:uncharacterized protein TERG_04244 [Trichophyton rubrum CBS 118892]|uniref:Uncharacterized protein n=1 Tax=Trichophyton rubrum (strain ATCC MYA-4607 / CBS 118892) TaxID=559305 RepID=F2SMT4_TRIRC|nr:uncharacterized protein TERG_04244 [Trichophyton rubrum CBS 118892]EGD87995.2 hypothetical protein TERG_04244 [Trichophyton rubrum CBS 118892]